MIDTIQVGDVIIVTLSNSSFHVTLEQAENIKRELQEAFGPRVKVVVIPTSADITIVHRHSDEPLVANKEVLRTPLAR